MNTYLLLLIIGLVVAVLTLTYFVCYNKMKKYKQRIDKAEEVIIEELNNKTDYIIKFDSEIKKITKKDYLEEYKNIKEENLSNIEKDSKLEEAEKLIKSLINDYAKISKSKEIKKLVMNLRTTNESLASAKNMFNNNAVIFNKIIKSFPSNIIAKILRYNYRSNYNIKTDGEETF